MAAEQNAVTKQISMAYNEITADRIRTVLGQKQVAFTEKKMFSGVCFMVDDKMLCGTHIDKKSGEDFLLCRLSPADYELALETNGVVPMDMGGKTMKGYVFVTAEAHKTEKQLAGWLQRCLDFNPLAKSSKK